MQANISIGKGAIFFAVLLLALAGSLGLAYSDFVEKSIVVAPQQCPVGKCVYGFDDEGTILCRPCTQASSKRGCTWDLNTAVIDHAKEDNFQYDACKKGEEYFHGEMCALSISETNEKCFYNGHWVKWQRASCKDSLWVKSIERYCKRDKK